MNWSLPESGSPSLRRRLFISVYLIASMISSHNIVIKKCIYRVNKSIISSITIACIGLLIHNMFACVILMLQHSRFPPESPSSRLLCRAAEHSASSLRVQCDMSPLLVSALQGILIYCMPMRSVYRNTYPPAFSPDRFRAAQMQITVLRKSYLSQQCNPFPVQGIVCFFGLYSKCA